MASTYNELNLDEVVRLYSQDMFQRSDDSGRNSNRLTYRIDYSRCKFVEEEPVFTSLQQGSPRSEVVYETQFRNDTDREQQFSLKTIKETTSVARFDLTRAIVANEKTKLRLCQLPPEISKSAGFTNELLLEKVGQHEFTEKLKWQIDTHVHVAPDSTSTATVEIKEAQYESDFTVSTKIYGNIHADVVDPANNNALVTTVDGDILKVIKNHVKKYPIPGVSVRGGCVEYQSSGHCKFIFGVKQFVNLS